MGKLLNSLNMACISMKKIMKEKSHKLKKGKKRTISHGNYY